MTYNPYVNSLSETDISAQFEGFEIEFDDKVTLFPVQVEKRDSSRRHTQTLSLVRPVRSVRPRVRR